MFILRKYDRLNVGTQSYKLPKFSRLYYVLLEISECKYIFLGFVIIRQNVNTVRCMNIQLTDNSCANDIFVYTGY